MTACVVNVGAGLGIAVVMTTLGACAPQRLHGRLLPAHLESRLREDFALGMSKGEVDGALDAARVPRRDRLMYPAGTDGAGGGAGGGSAGERVYLVRLFEPGGHWSDFYDEHVEFSDVTFVFAGTSVTSAASPPGGTNDGADDHLSALTLARVGVFYDVIRYIEDRPSGGLRREPAARARSYPALPPPPRDPLEGVKWIIGDAAEGDT